MEFEKSENKKYLDFNPILFGHELCEKSHSFGPAVRTYWCLHFVVSGKGKFIIEGREYIVRRDEIFVIPPFVETYYEADAQSPWEYIWIGFEANKLPFDLKDILYCPKARGLFEKIKFAEMRTNGRVEFLCAAIFELFSILLESETESDVDYIKTAVHIIHTEYVNGITVRDIAKRLNLERTYFSNLFTKEMGISPKRYLTNFRMKQAVLFMTKYHYSVTITALSVGYSDVYNFSKAFKSRYGVSPTEYIKNCKKV